MKQLMLVTFNTSNTVGLSDLVGGVRVIMGLCIVLLSTLVACTYLFKGSFMGARSKAWHL